MGFYHNPSSWYFDVNGSIAGSSTVWSGAAGAYVSTGNATYLDFIASYGPDGLLNRATAIPTDAALFAMLNDWAESIAPTRGIVTANLAGSNYTMTNPHTRVIRITGHSSSRTFNLPQQNLTTSMAIGDTLRLIVNYNGGAVVITDYAAGALVSLSASCVLVLTKLTNTTPAGTWLQTYELMGGSDIVPNSLVCYPVDGETQQRYLSPSADKDLLYYDDAFGQLRFNNFAAYATLIGLTTVRGSLAAAPFDALAYNGMQINGSMEVSQENGTTAVALATGTASEIIDMWQGKFVRAATLAISCQQVTPPGSPSFQSAFQKALQIKATTGLTPLANGDYGYLEHLIEGYRVSRLNFGSSGAAAVTIGFWVYATIAGTYTATLINSAANRSCPVNFTVSGPTTWEYKTVTFTGDTTGTWLFTTGTGLRVRFCFGAGSTFQGTNATWAASEVFATASTTNLFATTNNLACITGVVVIPGSEVPTSDRSPFIMRPFQEELFEAHRYGWVFAPGVASSGLMTGTAFNTSDAYGGLPYRRKMRAVPTLSTPDATKFAALGNGGAPPLTALALLNPNDESTFVKFTTAAAYTAGLGYILETNDTAAVMKLLAKLT